LRDPNCVHMNFRANVNVGRLSASETDDTIVGFTADVNIECAECGLPFEFVGLPMGSSPQQPMCSVDGLEARMPIKPQGAAMRTDLAGFSLRRVK
jgi:hypothetical protein